MRKDILLGSVDDSYDLLIENGDFVIGNSHVQHVRHIFAAHPGTYKQYPKLGIGIKDDINSPMDQSLIRKVQIHLKSDGYKPQNIKIVQSAIVVRL
jgi:hypothetical protein